MNFGHSKKHWGDSPSRDNEDKKYTTIFRAKFKRVVSI